MEKNLQQAVFELLKKNVSVNESLANLRPVAYIVATTAATFRLELRKSVRDKHELSMYVCEFINDLMIFLTQGPSNGNSDKQNHGQN